jgi:ArsR family metal-binding transcriptional regulator
VIFIQLKDFVGKPCSNKTSFEFLPKKKTIINLEKLSKQLNNIQINSKILLILKKDDSTISIFKNGKILVRGINEEKKARKIVEDITKKMF